MDIPKPISQRPIQIDPIAVEGLDAALSNLPRFGKLKQNEDRLGYLDIDDNYIHKTYAFIKNKTEKPSYFGKEAFFIGAHISVFYPSENVILNDKDHDSLHHFKILSLFKAKYLGIRIYALKVKTPSLADLRRIYHLPEKPSYGDISVDFHITVGTKILEEGLY